MLGMDVTPLVPGGSQLVNGYGDRGFTITGVRYEGSVIILPQQTHLWPVSAMDQITEDSLSPLFSATPRPSILILGCGKGMMPVPAALRTSLRAAGMVVEPMDTGAACRTYNVLLTEGRDVAAVLIAV